MPLVILCQGNVNALSPEKDKVGKIFFTSSRLKSGQEAPSLGNYTLTNKSNLFFVAFFDQPLTRYKQAMLPGISADSVYRMGNYQFSIFIDGKLVYRSELIPGAPPQKNQDEDTILNRPLIDNVNGQGSWSESFWNRFMNNGGDKVLTDGKHLLRMEIRAYVKSDSIRTSGLMASGELDLDVQRHPKIDIAGVRLNTPTPYHGLEVSSERFDVDKVRLLKGSIDEGLYRKINAVVVLKNGRILIEEYFNGEDRSSLHDPRSVGKSFVSTLTGIAIRDGFIRSETQTLGQFYALDSFRNNNASKSKASIKELLTMRSGFEGNDEDEQSPGNEENMYPTDNWVKFALDLPYEEKYKSGWHYFTAGVVLLGDVLNKRVPGGLEKYAEEKLFRPLGISNYQWQYTPQQVPNTAGGIRMNALDFAKYGQLYKNGGSWNGKQVIPRGWVEKSFSKQVKINGREDEFYGYLFWNKMFLSAGKRYDAFYCAGNGGNYIIVFKDQPLVVVITASAYGQPYAHSQVAEMLSDFILPAVVRDK